MDIPLLSPIPLAESPDVHVFHATGEQCEPFSDAALIDLISRYAELSLARRDAKLLVCDNIGSITELRASILGAWHAQLLFVPVVTVAREAELPSGADLTCALIIAQNLRVSAFAIDCADEQTMREQLARLAPYARVPLFARIDGRLEAYPHSTMLPPELSEVIVLCNETDVFYLDEDFELSEQVECELDMADLLLDTAEAGCDVISVHLGGNEDAHSFSLNAHMARLPVSFLAETEEALETALILYNGRAIIDSRSEVEQIQLEALAAGYGAVLR